MSNITKILVEIFGRDIAQYIAGFLVDNVLRYQLQCEITAIPKHDVRDFDFSRNFDGYLCILQTESKRLGVFVCYTFSYKKKRSLPMKVYNNMGVINNVIL